MIVEYTENFNKSTKKLKDKIAIKRLLDLVEKLQNATNLKEISNVVPIANHQFTYRIRTGNFRLVVEWIDDAISILLIEYSKRDEKTYKGYK